MNLSDCEKPFFRWKESKMAQCHIFIVSEEYRGQLRPVRFQLFSSDESRINHSKFITVTGADYSEAHKRAIEYLEYLGTGNFVFKGYKNLWQNSHLGLESVENREEWSQKWNRMERFREIERRAEEMWMNYVDSVKDRATFGGIG